MAKKQHKKVSLSEVQDLFDEEKEINAGEPDDELIDHNDFNESDRIDAKRKDMEIPYLDIPFDIDQEYNQQINDDRYKDHFNDDDRVENYGALLAPMPTMTKEQFNAINDPPPGTDYGWDTMSESEKNIFRNGGDKPHPHAKTAKTLIDLLRDMGGIEQPNRFVSILTMEADDLKDNATVMAYQKQRDPEKVLPSYRCAAMDEAIKEVVIDSLEDGWENRLTKNTKQIVMEPEVVSNATPTSLGALLRNKLIIVKDYHLDPITLREQSIRSQELVVDTLSTAYPSNCSRIADAKKDKF